MYIHLELIANSERFGQIALFQYDQGVNAGMTGMINVFFRCSAIGVVKASTDSVANTKKFLDNFFNAIYS